MSKRFVDTTLYEKHWFRKLSTKHKCLWEYVRLKCDNAGVLDFDEELASFQIGESVTWDDLGPLADQIAIVENRKIIIKDFISFQYGKLSESCNPHKQILELVSKHKLNERVLKPFMKSRGTLQDKEKDKEEEKDKEKELSSFFKKIDKYALNFEDAWQMYPEKSGKKQAEKHFNATVKTPEDFESLKIAIKNYLQSPKPMAGFIKNGSTFFNDWKAWVSPTPQMMINNAKNANSMLYMPNPYKTEGEEK